YNSLLTLLCISKSTSDHTAFIHHLIKNTKIKIVNAVFNMNVFVQFAQRYGSIYGLFIGSQPAGVLTGQKMIRQIIAGRSDNMMISRVGNSKGVFMANYGESWREHRRFALTTLRNFGLGKRKIEQRILEEVKYICSHLEESVAKLIDPEHLYHRAASNITIVIGQWVFPLPFCKAFHCFAGIKNHILKVVDEHRKSHVTGEPRDLIDCYLEEMEKINAPQMVTLLFDLFVDGTETTSNTLCTLMLYLMTHTHIEGKELNYLHAKRLSISRKKEIINLSMCACVYLNIFPEHGTIFILYRSSALRELSEWGFVKLDAFMPFSAGLFYSVMMSLVRPEDAGEPDFKFIHGGTQSVKSYRLTVQLCTPG
uniref:Uncharacterized protein n=1 Tax=Cyprinus carpio TaxID=7962 RepID=A0A8C1GA99_CYPCA